MTANCTIPERDAKTEELRSGVAVSLPQATLDALSAHIAVLDEAGGIIAVNRAWRAFAEANPPLSSHVHEGANYLAVCDAAKGPDADVAAGAAAGIRAVIRGDEGTFEMEYPCHSPTIQRWFVCRVGRLPGSDTPRVVVAHENITARKQAEQDLQASETRYRRLFESAKDGILILDAETGMIVDVNPFLIQLLGISREAFLGKEIWKLGFFYDIIANEAKFAELQMKQYVRYEDLPLETADGRRIEVEFVSNVYLVNDERVIQCNIRDVTERKRTERMAQDALTVLNRPNNTRNIIRDLLIIIKERTGMEAVGIRLKEGDDFPYYQTNGFPDSFVEMENHLCVWDTAGEVLKDSQGHPVLECLCGDVLCGRTDAAQPFFTKACSFWSNCTTDIPSTTMNTERPTHIRNRCNIEGYESVALIPLRAGEETIGLLQLNDHRRDQFTLELITMLEWLGASVGVALSRMRVEDKVHEQLAELELWHDVTLGREGRVIELKQEVNELLAGAGHPPKYPDAD